MVLATGALLGLAGCSCMPSKSIQTEEKTITSAVDDTTTECDADGQDQKRDFDADEPDTGRGSEGMAGDYTSLGEVETVNADALGNPKEVLDHMPRKREGRKAMSKYNTLWEYVQKSGKESFQLTFEEIRQILGIPIDHSFLKYKKELEDYGWQVGKISMKEQTVCFHKID